MFTRNNLAFHDPSQHVDAISVGRFASSASAAMSQKSRVNTVVTKLIASFELSDTYSQAIKDHVLQTLADSKPARTNQFEVAARFRGLDEKFRVFNNDELADALHDRLDELHAQPNRWTPEVLSLLLKLSDRPLEETRVEDLERFNPAVQPPPLTWSDIIADDPLDNHDGLWDDVDFAGDGSDEDADSLARIASSSDRESETSHDANDLSKTLQDLAIQPDTDGLNDILNTQFWNQAVIGATDMNGTKGVDHHSSIILTEAQVIREVGSMLLGLPTSIYEQSRDGKLTASSRYQLKHIDWKTVSPLLNHCALIGHELAIIRNWKHRRERYPLLQTFQACVEKKLAVLEVALAQIQARFVDPTGSTASLLSFHEEVQERTRLLRRFSPIIVKLSQVQNAQKSFAVLELLYDRVCMDDSTDDTTSLVYVAEIFLACLQTYLKPLRQWMEQGELDPRDQGIFIRKSEGQIALDSFWANCYTLLHDESGQLFAPKFLHLAARRILNAGKSVSFLNLLGYPWPEEEAKREDYTPVILDSVCGLSSSNILDSFLECFDKTMAEWIASSYHSTSALLRHQLGTQCGLDRILDAFEHIYLFRSGHLSSLIASAIFARLDRSGIDWSDCFILTDLFRNAYAGIDCIDVENLAVRSRHGSSRKSSDKERSVELLRTLRLMYTIPWPIANIITKDSMSIYQNVWVLLLQVQRAKQGLESRFSRSVILALMKDIVGSRAVMLRHRMLYWVNTVFAYLTNVVLSPATAEMRRRMAESDDLDGLIAIHRAYIRCLEEQCLLSRGQESILQAVKSVLDLVILFSETCVPHEGQAAVANLDHSRSSTATNGRKPHRRLQEADLSSSEEEWGDAKKESVADHVVLEAESSVARLKKMHDTFKQLHSFVLAGIRNVSKGGEDSRIELLMNMLASDYSKEHSESVT